MSDSKQVFRKKLQGKVVKLADAKTIVVLVERKFAHQLYGKIVAEHKKYSVHTDGKLEVNVGDSVVIESGKPISKRKSFYLVQKI